MMTDEGKEVFKAAKPFIRTALAFMVYLRYGSGLMSPIKAAYGEADQFMEQLQDDLR